MERPNVDLAKVLATKLGASYTYGVNVFAGPIMPASDTIPQHAIFVTVAGPGNLLRTYSGLVIRQTDISIRIREERGKYGTTEALANSIWLLTKYMDTGAGSGLAEYNCVMSTQASPLQILKDDQEHWGWAVNVRMDYVDN